MAAIIHITPAQPVVATPGTATYVRQPLSEATDVLPWDVLDLMAVCTHLVDGPATVGLSSGMQTQSEDGWLDLAATEVAFDAVGDVKPIQLDKGYYRFLRWYVKSAAKPPTVGFYITGVARRYGGA